jgi:hypothetical protein
MDVGVADVEVETSRDEEGEATSDSEELGCTDLLHVVAGCNSLGEGVALSISNDGKPASLNQDRGDWLGVEVPLSMTVTEKLSLDVGVTLSVDVGATLSLDVGTTLSLGVGVTLSMAAEVLPSLEKSISLAELEEI